MIEIKSNNDRNIVKKVRSKLLVGILLASVLIGMLTVIPEQVRAETWSIDTVDSAGDVGRFTSIALDSSGYPHISYKDNANMDLKYAKWTGSKWSITTVDSTNSVGEYTSIALDSKGYPHISYIYRTNLDLKYAKWTGSKWSITTVDSTNHFCGETSIALDSNDNPHISYRDSSNLDLKYAKWTGSKWSIETVDSAGAVGEYSSIALDSNDNPHISYGDASNLDLKYAKWTGSKWSIETVDSTDRVGYRTSIALDSNGYPHISYLDYTNTDLKYAKWTGSKWSIETVDSSFGSETSIALDSNGNPHISYLDYTNKDLKYAKAGSKWSIETVDSAGDVGYDTSIALDSKGYPHISYFDNTNDVLKYAAELLFLKVPTQPRNLKATAGDGSVNLKWTAPSDKGGSPITNYRIYRDTTSGVGTLLTTVGKMLAYTDNDVTNDRTYYYQVSAENSIGKGEKSKEVDASPKSSITETTAPLVTTPSAPLNFRASAEDGNVNLEWIEPSDEGGSLITHYNIYRGTTPGGETLRGRVSDVLNYTDDIVINNQTYYYQVSAENSAGEGNMSDEASATLIPGETVPSAPQDLNADRGDKYVDLSWNPPSNDGGSHITKYKVYRGIAPRGEKFVAEIDNAVNYRDYYVTNDQKYYYQVSARNLVGEGEMSNEVDVDVDVEPEEDTLGMGVWITIIVALIGALGVIAAALINYLSSKKTK